MDERLSARRCATASMRSSPSTTSVGDIARWMRINMPAGGRGVRTTSEMPVMSCRRVPGDHGSYGWSAVSMM